MNPLRDAASGSEAVLPQSAPEPASPIDHKIVQIDGRRYSIKLERCFWEALREIAEERQIRLNHLIGVIASQRRGEENLTSQLRVFCLRESRQRLTETSYFATKTSLLTVVMGSPAACLALSASQRIVATNPAFANWFGPSSRGLIGESVLRHFRLKGRRPFQEIWDGYLAGVGLAVEPVRLVNISPGRVLSANALLAPVIVAGRTGLMGLIWLAH